MTDNIREKATPATKDEATDKERDLPVKEDFETVEHPPEVLGFCMKCGTRVPMLNVVTKVLPNQTLVDEGICARCSSYIWRRKKEGEIFYDPRGRKIPFVVHVGKETPKKLVKNAIKERLIGEVIKYVRDKTDVQPKRTDRGDVPSEPTKPVDVASSIGRTSP